MAKPSVEKIWSKVAHDLRQPIQSLLLLTHVMALTEDGQQRQSTSISMEVALADLQTMLDHLAMVAKLEVGEQPSVEPLELGDVVPKVIDRLSHAATLSGHDFQFDPAIATIAANRWLVEFLIENLTYNVLRHARKGTIQVATGRTSKGSCEIRFSYGGKWPKPAHFETLFIELRINNPAAPTSVPGLGLLAIVAKNVQCNISSREVNGSTTLQLDFPTFSEQ